MRYSRSAAFLLPKRCVASQSVKLKMNSWPSSRYSRLQNRGAVIQALPESSPRFSLSACGWPGGHVRRDAAVHEIENKDGFPFLPFGGGLPSRATGMGGTAGGRLASAVSEAGGLGLIGGGRNHARKPRRSRANLRLQSRSADGGFCGLRKGRTR
jgi:hypothetical protein